MAACLSAGISPVANAAQLPSNPNAGPKTAQMLQWMSSLKYRSDNKIIVGQFVSPNYGRPEKGFPTVQDAWNYHIGELNTITGRTPSMVGFDMCDRTYQAGTSAQNTPSITNLKTLSLSHHANGGIVMMSWHAPNPFTLEGAWSALPANRSLTELTTPGTAAYTQWMTWLSAVGDNLQWYKDQGIPVVWRPFHEMNATQFWWGSNAPAADYVVLWKHMYNYLTTTRGLNNVLWAWSPNSYSFDANTTGRYPGNSYVDIMGHERYADNLTRVDLYNWMNDPQFNKVIFFTEAGKPSSMTALWDNMKMVNEIRNTYKNVVGFMSWMKTTVDFSIRGNNNATPTMNDVLSETLDDNPGTMVDDSRTDLISYTGTWAAGTDAAYLNGTKSVSNAVGSTASLIFNATSVAIYVKKLASGGKFDVYVDNVYKSTIDTYSATDQFGVKAYQVSGLAAGQNHTVKISLANPNGYVGFDYFSYK